MRKKSFWMFIALMSVFFGCATYPYIQFQVQQAAKSLPQPENVELVAETIRDASGSDCITVSYYWIYGPKIPLDEIYARYREILLRAGWEEVIVDQSVILPKFRKMHLGIFRKGDYRLRVDQVNDEDAVSFAGLYSQKSYIRSRFREFGILIMLSLSLSGPCPEARSE